MKKARIKLPTSILAKHVVRKVVLFALLMIILFSGTIGIITYFNEMDKFDQRLAEIEQSYLGVIRQSLWINDKDNLETALIGICRLPGIGYADIHSGSEMICKAGQKDVNGKLSRIFPIFHTFNNRTYALGELHIAGSTDYVRQKILRSMITGMLTQAATIFIVCVLILVLIYQVVIGRLLKITQYASSLTMDSLDTPLVMDRTARRPDELDQLAQAINDMREDLRQSFVRKKAIEDRLKQHHQDLEETVRQRTVNLKTANDQLRVEIDERNRIEKALQEKEQFLSAVFDSIQDGICVLDNDLNVIRVNRTMKHFYAYALPLEGKKCYTAYHRRDEPCDDCPVLRAIRTGKLEREEVPYPVKGGATGTLELFAFPMFDDSGQPSGVVEYIRDITERKQAESALGERERMQGVLEMAGAVCHEMNQPLMVISGITELMAMDMPDDDLLFDKISKITEQAGKLGRITRKLMSITKYETKDYLERRIIDIEKSST